MRLQAGDGLQLAVRINLVARERSMERPDPARLKACVAPDYYLLAPAGADAVMAAHAAQDVLLLSIPPEAFYRRGLVGNPGCPLSPLRGRVLVDPVVTGLVEQLAQSSSPEDQALNASVLDTLLLTLVRIARTRAREATRGGLTARQLGVVREHVEARLDRPIRNADLAALTGLSPFHFARSFKESMGMPPAGWIRLRRLTVAQRLLVQPERSITDVAAAVGYDSPSRFARAFRDATGVSPSQFRRAQA
ncbi:helix-turn-helix transcriptional regulator [Brevundimonas subvibrioides]|nr:helix-turn-helix transcriptional regulator [Brevundimonas subvibrioides]